MKIPKIKLTPAPDTKEEEAAIGYKYNFVAGTRHYLGGEPNFYQPSSF